MGTKLHDLIAKFVSERIAKPGPKHDLDGLVMWQELLADVSASAAKIVEKNPADELAAELASVAKEMAIGIQKVVDLRKLEAMDINDIPDDVLKGMAAKWSQPVQEEDL